MTSLSLLLSSDIIPTSSKEKGSEEISYAFRSLVMVREPVALARGLNNFEKRNNCPTILPSFVYLSFAVSSFSLSPSLSLSSFCAHAPRLVASFIGHR